MNIECERCGSVIAVYVGTHPTPTSNFLCPACAEAPAPVQGDDPPSTPRRTVPELMAALEESVRRAKEARRAPVQDADRG